MFDVIKNAPEPAAGFGRGPKGRASIYPFASLELGDAFDVPLGDEPSQRVRARITSAATYYRKAKAPDARFSIYTLGDALRVHRKA